MPPSQRPQSPPRGVTTVFYLMSPLLARSGHLHRSRACRRFGTWLYRPTSTTLYPYQTGMTHSGYGVRWTTPPSPASTTDRQDPARFRHFWFIFACGWRYKPHSWRYRLGRLLGSMWDCFRLDCLVLCLMLNYLLLTHRLTKPQILSRPNGCSVYTPRVSPTSPPTIP